MCVLWLRSMASRLNFFLVCFVLKLHICEALEYTQQQHIAKISSSVPRFFSLVRLFVVSLAMLELNLELAFFFVVLPPLLLLLHPSAPSFSWRWVIFFGFFPSWNSHFNARELQVHISTLKKTKIATRSVAQIAMGYAIEFQIFKLNCMRSRCFEARVEKGNKQNRASKQCDNKEKYAIFSVEKHREWSEDGNYSTFWQNCILFVRTLATTFWRMHLKLARICCRCAGSRIRISHEAMNDLSEILPDSFTFIFATKF